MMKSMYAGISAMKSNQTKMDVVGNNVANVGTTAFKKSGARFSDALNQTIIYASAPTGGIGGINPGQVGIGTKVSGIYKYMTQGSLQPTGRPTDLAIDGDGFFVVEKGDQTAYTRDGSFSLDSNGDLVTADGYKVLGIGKDNKEKSINIPQSVPVDGKDVKVVSYNIAKDGSITLALEDGTKSDTGVKVKVSTFVNPEGLEAASGNLYLQSANSGKPVNGEGSIIQGAIEMSNVDLSEEFTEMIVTTRAFQAASKIISTSDELLQEIINLKR